MTTLLPLALVVGAALILGRGIPDPGTIVVVNHAPGPVLVDLRSWGGASGVGGPLARPLEPESSAVLYRPVGNGTVCVRVIDPASLQVVTGLVSAVADARQREIGDTTYVVVETGERGGLRPVGDDPCPQHLAGHRVRVAPGRYFEPGTPPEIRRERLIRRLQEDGM